MRNFLKLAENIDVIPVLHALHNHDELWNQNNLRTLYPGSPHREADDILFWFNDLSHLVKDSFGNIDFEASSKVITVVDDKDVIPYPAWNIITQVRILVFDLMRRVEGVRLGRTMATRLKSGDQIYPHDDSGAPAEYYSRYHIILQNGPGSLFNCGNETVTMKAGECYQFRNKLCHSVQNNSTIDRITLIVDIRLG